MSTTGSFERKSSDYVADIRVVGVGGGGVNAVNRMVDAGIEGVEFIALNTDAKQLLSVDADVKIDIGRELVGGLGAGSDPDIGRKAAEESAEQIRETLEGAQMVFITTGEGGGTGTGAAPVVARIARELGCLTIGIVTKPFVHEGNLRMQKALSGIDELRNHVDSLIIVPNEKLLDYIEETGKEILLTNAFAFADEVLMQSVRAITSVIINDGYIGADFSDVKSIMEDSGTAIIGIGEAEGDDRILRAAEMAVTSPLLESRIDGAKGVIFVVQGAEESLGTREWATAAKYITESSDPNALIKNAISYDETLGNSVQVIVIATGFDKGEDPDQQRVEEIASGKKSPANYALDTNSETDISAVGNISDIDDSDVNYIKPNTSSFNGSTDYSAPVSYLPESSSSNSIVDPISGTIPAQTPATETLRVPSFVNSSTSNETVSADYLPNTGAINTVAHANAISTPNEASLFSSDRNSTVSGTFSTATVEAGLNESAPISGSFSSVRPLSGSVPTVSGAVPTVSSNNSEDNSLELPGFMK